MKIAYFDCFAGASGDMILGSLMDAGLDLGQLDRELAKLHLTHYNLRKIKVVKKGISGTQAVVSVDEIHHQHHRNLNAIEEIITKSGLEKTVKQLYSYYNFLWDLLSIVPGGNRFPTYYYARSLGAIVNSHSLTCGTGSYVY